MEIMKRDMDLCRTILFEVEKFPFRTDWINLKIDGYSKAEIAYHVMILNQAGLIDARNLDTLTDWRPINCINRSKPHSKIGHVAHGDRSMSHS